MHQLVAIDFSISSTAMSIRKDGVDYHFSFVPNYDQTSSKFKVHRQLDPLVKIVSYEKAEKVEGYSEGELVKLQNAQNLAKAICAEITGAGALKPRVAFEGFSFGSRGSSFIDLIVFNTFAKKHIMDTYFCPIEVGSPATIKKHFCGKGNATKAEMFSRFAQVPGHLRDLIVSVIGEIDPEKEPPKPIDDIVDSVAILNWMSGAPPCAPQAQARKKVQKK